MKAYAHAPLSFETYVKIGTRQRNFAWPLGKDNTTRACTFVTIGANMSFHQGHTQLTWKHACVHLCHDRLKHELVVVVIHAVLQGNVHCVVLACSGARQARPTPSSIQLDFSYSEY